MKGNDIKSKFWRAIIVVYFIITIPCLLIAFSLVRALDGELGTNILQSIGIFVFYVILTDILRGAMYYIDSGNYKLAIRNKIKSLF